MVYFGLTRFNQNGKEIETLFAHKYTKYMGKVNTFGVVFSALNQWVG
jgi:hypothetical protein